MNNKAELSGHLEKFNKETVKKVIKDILKNYVILDKNMDKVKEETLIRDLLNVEQVERCSGVVSSGGGFTQCTRNASDNGAYCKTHVKKYQNKTAAKRISVQDEMLYLVKSQVGIDDKNLKKVFIEDSFYFVDDNFIYDNVNQILSKVGYIEQGEYVLTDDPFILNHKGECFL